MGFRRRIAICPHCHRIVEAKPLTFQQWEVAKRLIAGEATASIAHDLFVSIKTVETHRTKIMEVLGVKNIAQLIRWANDNGLLALMGWETTKPHLEETPC